jgi:hypothetical protein
MNVGFCTYNSSPALLLHFELIKMAIVKKVEDLMKRALSANKSDIDEALIKPISEEWPFSTNGVYFFVGKMGSGKSYYIWKHIYVTERIQKNGYYQEIIFCTTSGKLDQTAEPLRKNVRTLIKHIREKHLISYLTQHLKWKSKYYSICRHVLSKFKRTDEKLEELIEKHSLQDIRDRLDYIAEKLCKYGTSEYPYRTLLVMDDFAASPLLEEVNSPISKFLTKTRHYDLTAIIVAQTWRFIILNLKRLATDVVAYVHFSEEDFSKIFPSGLIFLILLLYDRIPMVGGIYFGSGAFLNKWLEHVSVFLPHRGFETPNIKSLRHTVLILPIVM